MLKVVRNPEFTAPVTVQLLADDDQGEGHFEVRFRALTTSETAAHDLAATEGMTAFLRAVVRGWQGLADDEGQPFPFSAANFDLLLDLPHFRVALTRAYFSTTLGVVAAKRGN